MSKKPDYDRGYDDGVRAAIEWLAKRADSLDDPDTRHRHNLHSAATNLGWALKAKREGHSLGLAGWKP